MNLDKFKNLKKSDLTVTIVLVIGILAVINFFAYQLFFRLDLTENKVYSISAVSKKTIGDLDDIVNIKAYFSAELPSQFMVLKQEVGDILGEYEAFSKGNVKVEFINPADDEETKQDLYMKRIPQLTFQVFEKDKAQVVNGYMGITIGFGDKIQTIPVVKQDTRDFEYQITTAIKKVTSDNIGTVGFLNSQGVSSPEQISNALQSLQELYTVEPVDFTEAKEIPAEIKTLAIIGPKEKFSEDQLKAINSFVARGGALLVCLDGVTVGEGLAATKNVTGLEGLLEKYGVKVNGNLVADGRNAMATFNQGFFSFSTNYPYWLKITNEGFDKDNSAVSNLENVVLQWASSLDIVSNTEAIKVLARTTNRAWAQTDGFNLAPGNISVPSTLAQYNLVAFVNGEINNPYDSAGAKMPAKIIVVGDSDFVGNNGNPDNLTLFQNLIDSLNLDGDLISIRSKNVSSRPISEDLSDAKRQSIRYLNIFGVTVVVVAFGLIRYYLRRKSRFVDQL